MPVMRCQRDNMQGYKWGESGYCYTYKQGDEESKKRAQEKALKQGLAIGDIEATMLNSKIKLNAKGEIIIESAPATKYEILADGNIIKNSPETNTDMTLRAGERLGTMLERKRLAMNLTPEQIANKLPIREDKYRMIEAGYNRRPPDDILGAIAGVLKLDVEELKSIVELDLKEPVEPRDFSGYPEASSPY